MNYSTTWQEGNLNRGAWQRGSTQKVIRQGELPIKARSIEDEISPLVEVRKSNFIFGAFLFFVLAFQIYTRLEIVNSLYKLDELRAEKTYKQSSVSELNFALEKLYQPDLIVRNAENKLGLVITPPQRIRRLR